MLHQPPLALLADEQGGVAALDRDGADPEQGPIGDPGHVAQAVVGAGFGLVELRPMRMSLEEIFLQLTTTDTPDAEVAHA